MTTRSTTPTPVAGELVDAPAIHLERLSDQQREGRACCWCSGTPDRRFLVRILRVAGVRLHACTLCAGMYGVQESAS